MIDAIVFLSHTLAGFFSFLLLLRFFMQWQRVSFANQIGVFVVELTNWGVRPLRRLIPGKSGFDFASVLLAWVLQLASIAVFWLAHTPGEMWGQVGVFSLLSSLAWQALLSTLRLAVYLFIGAIFVQVVLSWVQPFSSVRSVLEELTRPLLKPIQRHLPLVANVDLAPLVAILLLQAVLFLL